MVEIRVAKVQPLICVAIVAYILEHAGALLRPALDRLIFTALTDVCTDLGADFVQYEAVERSHRLISSRDAWFADGRAEQLCSSNGGLHVLTALLCRRQS